MITELFIDGLEVMLQFVDTAYASVPIPSPQQAIDNTTIGIASQVTATTFSGVATAAGESFALIVNVIAAMMIARSGLYLAFEQSDENVGLAQRNIIGSIIAVIIVNLAPNLAQILWSGTGGIVTNPDAVSEGITQEIQGIIDWIEVPVAIIAILMIITTGIRAVTDYGSDQGVTKLRLAVLSNFGGIILIVLKVAISDAVTVTFRPETLFDDIIVQVIAVILGLVTLIAVAVLIFAGFLMIANVGNDSQYEQAKGIVVRVLLGILIIIVSVALASIITFI